MVALAGWPEPVYVAMEDQSQWERRRSRPPSPTLLPSAPLAPHAPAEKHRSTRPTPTAAATYGSHSHHREDVSVRSTNGRAAHPTSFSRSRENSPPLPSSSVTPNPTATSHNDNNGNGTILSNGGSASRPPPRSIFAASCPYTTEGRPCPFPNHPDCFAGGHGQARLPVPSLPLPQLPRLPRPLQPPPPRPRPSRSTDHTDQREGSLDEAEVRGGGSPLRRKTSLPPDFFKAPLSPPPSASASKSSCRPSSRTATSPTSSHSPNGTVVHANSASARRHGSALTMTMTSAKRSGLLVYKPTPIPKASDGGAALPRTPRTDQTMATEVYPRDPDSGFLWGGGKDGEEPDTNTGQRDSSMEVDS